MTAAPLEGVKVLDLTRALSGPMCTALLSDMGADVVKVEPFGGEETRNWPPMSDNLSLYWASINRGKRSIELDTRTADGKEVLRRLARGVDVIVENYRPGVLRRVGLDIEELRAENPRLVVASISGHGPVGPLRDVPGLDQIAQGMSGLMSVTGAGDQTPMRVGVPIVDTLAGIFAALAVSAAVAGAERTGEGAIVQTSLLEAAMAVMSFQAQGYLTTGVVPEPEGTEHPVVAPYGVFATRDDPINIAAATESQWKSLCGVLGAADLLTRGEFADRGARLRHRSELTAELETYLRERPALEWITLIRDAGVPCGPIHRMDQVFADPQIQAIGMVQNVTANDGSELAMVRGPLWFDGQPTPIRSHPPACGAHTLEILLEAGLSQDEVTTLRSSGALRPEEDQ